MKKSVGLVALVLWAMPVAAAEVNTRTEPQRFVLQWRGDETIEVSISRTRGLLRTPVELRADGRAVSFEGFYAVFNGVTDGYTTKLVEARTRGDSVQVVHTMEHPELPAPARLIFDVSMSADSKAIRFRVAATGEKLHLDRLGLGPHRGDGIAPARMFFSKMFVLEPPIGPFRVRYNYNSARFWAFTMTNGLTEMIGSDSAPREFIFDPAAGVYDLPTYCDSPITYTFVVTGKGHQEAIAHYRGSIDTPAPATISQLPGRVSIMTAHPIRERYEDFLDDITGRGVRDFIWVAYAPWPGEREMVERFGALYSVYDMYTDLFEEGPRKAEGFTPDWARYDRPGQIERGYWNAARCLPNLYIDMAKRRVQGTLGRELEGRGFLKTGYTKYSNLTITREELRPSALYLDVHASMTPRHYYDSRGTHYSVAESLKQEKALFDYAREHLGDVPVFSEVDGEAFAGIMDAGIFTQWPTPEKLGIQAGSWEYYPVIELVHRGRLLNSGAGWPFALPQYDARNMALCVQFGRPAVISAYHGAPQADVGGRARLYYLSSAFHKMLGLARLERVDFEGASIRRQIAQYSNGARIWSNRGPDDWPVEGLHLPPDGYLITGPGGFREYRARKEGQIVEEISSPDYLYFAAGKPFDFGPVATSGALAVRASEGKIVVYELVKPQGQMRFRLGAIPQTSAGRKVQSIVALMTRGRKLELNLSDYKQTGDVIQLRPVEMAAAVGYEIQLAP
jgi:hypothetical protein